MAGGGVSPPALSLFLVGAGFGAGGASGEAAPLR